MDLDKVYIVEKSHHKDENTKYEVTIDNMGFIHTKMSCRIHLPDIDLLKNTEKD